MPRHQVPPDEWQYRDRSSDQVRGTLLRLTRDFVLASRQIRGVIRIALFGSLATSKARPKDADVLVSIRPPLDLAPLARLARRFQGRAQGINSTADVFLATPEGEYLGRVCHYRECYRRRSCRARNCGTWPHLNDDLDVVALPDSIVVEPPLVLHPTIMAAATVPDDIVDLLLAPGVVPSNSPRSCSDHSALAL